MVTVVLKIRLHSTGNNIALNLLYYLRHLWYKLYTCLYLQYSTCTYCTLHGSCCTQYEQIDLTQKVPDEVDVDLGVDGVESQVGQGDVHGATVLRVVAVDTDVAVVAVVAAAGVVVGDHVVVLANRLELEKPTQKETKEKLSITVEIG